MMIATGIRRADVRTVLAGLLCVLLAIWCTITSAAAATPIFGDDFEVAFGGWLTGGTPDWHSGSPSNGSHCVHFTKNESIERTIPTTGYADVTLGFYLGAENLDRADEHLGALWHDGVDWVVLTEIRDGDPEEDGQLHYYEFALPPEAGDRPDFAVRFKMTGRAGGESGYVDDVVVLGLPGEVSLSLTGVVGSVLVDGDPESLPWSGSFATGSVVTLEAVPDGCHMWLRWSGDLDSSENPIDVSMDADVSLQAEFSVLQYSLRVTASGSGAVEVGGVEEVLPYEMTYDCGTTVTLEAIPDEGWQFAGWVGDATGSDNPISALLASDTEVSATFTAIQHTLSLSGSNGRVLVDDAVCDLPWSGAVQHGEAVSLEAVADDCWRFDVWSGDLSGTSSPVDVVVEADMSIALEFVSIVVFTDIDCDHWVVSEAAACHYAGIVGGYPDGTYGPHIATTREQMAVYVCRALVGGDDSVPDAPPTASFPDVPTDYWAFDHIEHAVTQQVVQGYPDGEYKPGIELDRGQMAVFIARAMAGGDAAVPDHPGDPSFSDVGDEFWASRHIEYIAGQDVATGYDDGCYHPEYLCTRDQMAVYIARAFDLPL
jgi:hypothetical protein